MVQTAGNLAPHVAFFAAEDIPAGFELTFAYGAPRGPPKASVAAGDVRAPRRCLCGSAACLGFLPTDG